MFFFQLPFVPEWALRAHDLKLLTAFYRSKKGGLTNQDEMTDEDVEALKYTFGKPGNMIFGIHHFCKTPFSVSGL